MNSYEDVAIKKLAQVVKDHDNHATMDLVRMCNSFCRTLCCDYSSNWEDVWSADRQMRYPQTPCRLVVVEQGSHGASLSKAHASLTSYGLLCELEIVDKPVQPNLSITAPSSVTSVVRGKGIVMSRCGHALRRGIVYVMPAEAGLTFIRMIDVNTYVNKLLANDALRERIL